MKFHIVRDGETIKDIMFLYSISEDELKEDNRHIRKWDRLIPGTKLKISVITKSDDEDIMQMEPFIEDYYPKEVKIEDSEVIKETVLNEDNKSSTSEEVVVEATEVEPVEDAPKEEIIKKDSEDIKQINNEVRNEPNHNYIRKQRYIYYPCYVYYPVYINNVYPYMNRNRFR